MVDVPISPAVLSWAREFRGLGLEEAAEKLGIPVDELCAYETGKQQPTLTKFEKFASGYRLPQATLFRRTPPREPPQPRDFRTFEGASARFGFAFRVTLSNVRTLQRTLRILSEEDEEFLWGQLPRYDRQRTPWEQGEEERRRIGLSVQEQLDWPGAEAFRRWRAIIERSGISVYLQKFDLSDCRGYSLLEMDSPPAIVVNKSEDYEGARNFTLIHEYAHLLIREPGISDQDFRNPVEAFCNRFAASFLIPMEALQAVLPIRPSQPIDWDREDIRYCAARLKVSQQAFALRLQELELAPAGFYKKFAWKGQSKKIKSGEGGGNYVATRLSDIGGRYTSAVIGALDRQVIDRIQASEALGLPTSHFETARGFLKRQRALAGDE